MRDENMGKKTSPITFL